MAVSEQYRRNVRLVSGCPPKIEPPSSSDDLCFGSSHPCYTVLYEEMWKSTGIPMFWEGGRRKEEGGGGIPSI